MNPDDEIDCMDALRGQSDDAPCCVETRVFPADDAFETVRGTGIDIDLAFEPARIHRSVLMKRYEEQRYWRI